MISGLDVALRVITAPNSAFAHIRDNDGAYFRWAVCIFVLASILTPIASAALYPALLQWENALMKVWLGLLGGTASTALIYLMGRVLGGNGSWRKVFSVVFYTNVIAFPPLVVLAVLAAMSGSPTVLASLSGSSTMLVPMAETPLGGAGQPDFAGFGQGAGDWIGLFMIVSIAALIAYWVWSIVISVKAVKTVNGFGTGKAFGLLVIVYATFIAVSVPFSM